MSFAHSTPTPTARSLQAADDAQPKRRVPSAQGAPTVRPTTAGFYLAYLANGDTPPWPLADRLLFGFTAAAGGLCILFGAWGAVV